jgi:hypothetical protein
VDRFDADGTGVFGPESTNPSTPGALKKHSIRRSGLTERRQRVAGSRMVVTWHIIMRAANAQFPSWPRARNVIRKSKESLRRKVGIVMEATLPHRAPDSYSEHWLRFFGRKIRGRFAGHCP